MAVSPQLKYISTEVGLNMADRVAITERIGPDYYFDQSSALLIYPVYIGAYNRVIRPVMQAAADERTRLKSERKNYPGDNGFMSLEVTSGERYTELVVPTLHREIVEARGLSEEERARSFKRYLSWLIGETNLSLNIVESTYLFPPITSGFGQRPETDENRLGLIFPYVYPQEITEP